MRNLASRMKAYLIILLVYTCLAVATGMVEQGYYYDVVNAESGLAPYTAAYFADMPVVTRICYHLHFDVLRFPVGTLLSGVENPLVQQIVIFSFILNGVIVGYGWRVFRRFRSRHEKGKA